MNNELLNELLSHQEHYTELKTAVSTISSIHGSWNDFYLEEAFEKFSNAIDEVMYAIETQESLERKLIEKYDGDVPYETWEEAHRR